MSVKEPESELNRRLKEIHKGYAVKNLKRLPSGEYWFDLAMGFDARDMAKVNRVFAELLAPGRSQRQHTVQAKFQLCAETYEPLRREAAERGVKQSALVEEALQSALPERRGQCTKPWRGDEHLVSLLRTSRAKS